MTTTTTKNPSRLAPAQVPKDVTMLPEDDPVLLSYSQVAKLLNVSDRSVWSLVNKSKVLPAIRVGAAVRIDRRDVIAFIDGQRTPA